MPSWLASSACIVRAPQADGQAATRSNERIDDRPTVQVLSFTAPRHGWSATAGAAAASSTGGAWPVPMVWACQRTGEAMLRIVSSVINGWWRFGDPSTLFSVEYDAENANEVVRVRVPTADGSTVEVPFSLLQLKQGIDAVMAARKGGNTGDAYAYVEGGKVSAQTIGDVDATLMKYFKEQSSVFAGDIIGASRTPVWMYPGVSLRAEGMGSGLSLMEASICAEDAKRRTRLKMRLAREVIDMHLVLQGRARDVGRYTLRSEGASVIDQKLVAEADKARAEATAAEIENAVQLFDDDGEPRFKGQAEEYLRRHDIIP